MSCSCKDTSRYPATLVHRKRHNAITYSFEFEVTHPLEWESGSHSTLYLPTLSGEMGRVFSHASRVSESKIQFTMRIRPDAGYYKRHLLTLSPGARVEISEPATTFALRREGRPVVLLSSGVGIAAIRPHVLDFEADPRGIPSMLQITVDRAGALFSEDFQRLEEARATFRSVHTSSRTAFYSALDFELQAFMMASAASPYVYVVGSGAFVEETAAHLMAVGFSPDDIVTDGKRPKALGSQGGCSCGIPGGCGCGANA